MSERNNVLLGSLVFTTCLFLVSMILGFIAYTTDGVGIFPKGAVAVTEEHMTQFTPENWVPVTAYILIYVWMTLAFIYSSLNIFRTSREGPFYCNPVLITVEICLVFSISWVFHIVCLFLWTNEKIVAAAVMMAMLSIVNWSAIVLFSIRLWDATAILYHDSPLDLWCYRILFQNGLATYATWTTVEFFIKFGAALGKSDQETEDEHPIPAATSIILVTFFISIWTSFELLIWDRYFRYMFTPLMVILWLVSCVYGRLSSMSHQDQTVKVYSLVLICIVTPLLTFRMIWTAFRHFYMPLVKNF